MIANEDFFEQKRTECIARIDDLYNQMERASIATKGDYQNRISNEEANLEIYEEKLRKHKNALQPSQILIFCYVIVSTKDRVKINVGEGDFNKFEADRYHDSNLAEWKPYQQKQSIDCLLLRIRDDYKFEPIYLDGDIDNCHWLNLDNNIDNSVAIIDLFSLDKENMKIAYKFDTTRAGVLMPLCKTINTSLTEFASSCKDNFKVLGAKTKSIACNCYAFDISSEDRFLQDLRCIFKQKFPIKNYSNKEVVVRNLKFDIQ